MAEVTRCRNTETGHEAELPTDALGAYVRLGWEAISESRSSDAAEQERIDRDNEAAARVQTVVAELTTAEKPPTIAEILDTVGDDPEAARAALDIEQGTDSPRTTLVARLTQIIDTAGDAGNHQED